MHPNQCVGSAPGSGKGFQLFPILILLNIWQNHFDLFSKDCSVHIIMDNRRVNERNQFILAAV